MSSARPTSTVSSKQDRVFTSELVSLTAFWMTSVMVRENTRVLKGSPGICSGKMIAVWVDDQRRLSKQNIDRVQPGWVMGASSRRTFMQVTLSMVVRCRKLS